jgi:hypothetical protein
MPIKVLLTQLPSTIQEALEDVLSRQPDMRVAKAGNHMEVLIAAGETQADVVILETERSEPPGIGSHLLAEYPHLKIVLIAARGQRYVLYQLQQETRRLGEASSEELVDIIRAMVDTHPSR